MYGRIVLVVLVLWVLYDGLSHSLGSSQLGRLSSSHTVLGKLLQTSVQLVAVLLYFFAVALYLFNQVGQLVDLAAVISLALCDCIDAAVQLFSGLFYRAGNVRRNLVQLFFCVHFRQI